MASGSFLYVVVLLVGSTVRRHIDTIKVRFCANSDIITIPEEDETFQY